MVVITETRPATCIHVALLNIRFTNSQNGSMQYFGKEPWLSTKTGGGGGGGGSKYKN